MNEDISIEEARRISLAAQGFATARPAGRIDRRHLRKTMSQLQLLQLDSVPVLIRTHYMPFFSRLGPYRTELLDDVAYDADEWFEAWSHEASLLPVETEPWLRWSKQRARQGETWGRLYATALKERSYVDEVLGEVTARGPLAAGELTNPRPRSGDWWGSRSIGSVALDWLFRIGVLGVRRRKGFVKEFDLLERIVPAEIRSRPTPSFEESLDELLLRSARAHGIATADCLVDCLERWWLSARDRFAHIDTLVLNLDNGPENHSRRTQFMARLVTCAARHQLTIHLAYYPPYHSKYNPVERCWGILENYWNGALLDSVDTVLNFAANTTYNGHRPTVELVTTLYHTGVKLTQKAMRAIEAQIKRLPLLEKWFVTINGGPSSSGMLICS